jgi:GNAT superfamily N-acetyltransferase
MIQRFPNCFHKDRPMRIRPATEADVPAILSLIRELADYEHLSDQCIATEPLLAQHLFGPEKAASALVAEVPSPNTAAGGGATSIVAYALYFKTFSTFLARPGLYLEDLYVQPPHRNQGIGTALLQHLAQLCTQNNYGRLEWSVLDWNTPSIAFYQSLGAHPLNDWTQFRLTGKSLAALAQ